MITRRKVLFGGSALMAMPAIRCARAATSWYVQPPNLVQMVRPDGFHVMPNLVQRDRIIGARTRPYTASGKVFNFTRAQSNIGGSPSLWPQYAKFDDGTYQGMLAANPRIFADCTVTNSIANENSHTVDWTVSLCNTGQHPQLCVMLGDSLMASVTGGSQHRELDLVENQLWAQPVTSKSAPYTSRLGVYGPAFNKEVYTADPTQRHARICFDFGFNGWRLGDVPGIKYPGTSGAWANQGNYISYIPVAPGQQLAFLIQAASNDMHLTGNTKVLLHGRPEFGRPNLVQDCLASTVAMIRSLYPNAKVGVITPIARWWTPTEMAAKGQPFMGWANSQFSAYADWLISPGNAASIGVDAVWDSRTDPALDCRNAANVVLDTSIYQADKTHLMVNGCVNHLGAGVTSLLDGFWPPRSG
jgi:hypothetical protein